LICEQLKLRREALQIQAFSLRQRFEPRPREVRQKEKPSRDGRQISCKLCFWRFNRQKHQSLLSYSAKCENVEKLRRYLPRNVI